jgi:hypothetical protein
MMLADRICAEAGSERDRTMCSAYTEMAKDIAKAERFVLDLNSTLAAAEVRATKPSSVLDAIHLSRPPFPMTWLEWPFTEMKRAQGVEIDLDDPERPTPRRVGCLIQDQGDDAWSASFAWDFAQESQGSVVGVLGMACSNRGQMPEIQAQGRGLIEGMAERHPVLRPLAETVKTYKPRTPTAQEMKQFAKDGELLWKSLSDAEAEAATQLSNYSDVCVSPYAAYHAAALYGMNKSGKVSDEIYDKIVEGWKDDVVGEGAFVRSALLLINSRNAVEHEPSSLDRLNKSRIKQRKRPLLSHSVVKLNLSKVQMRRLGPAGPGAGMRLHIVRGHFKVRRTGVYWWSNYLRGNAADGVVERSRYEVAA